jgi:hypothetical protein
MKKVCKQCSSNFEFGAEDKKICDRFEIPAPDFCVECRHQRRLAFRNEWNLFKRNCDCCGRGVVTVYHPDSDLVVYCPECFWSDKWNPTDYGRDFDFSRSFFEQYKELQKVVPLLSNVVHNSDNSEFNAFVVDSRNAYRSTRVGDSEDVFYAYLVLHSERCVDCYNVSHSQDMYECIDCFTSNHCYYSQLCRTSSELRFCYDMIGCHDCFGCVGLRNVRYHFFNKKYSKEEYFKKLEQYSFSSQKNLREVYAKFYDDFVIKQPIRHAVIVSSERVRGNYILESKDVDYSFDIEKTDTCRNSWGVEFGKDIYDCEFSYYAENCYQNISNSKSQNIRFCFCALTNCYDLEYSMFCFNNSHDSFGCLSLKKSSYLLLNKQYSEDEYKELRARVVAHMKSTGEWGNFFPYNLSLYHYNDTVAQEYFPLKKNEAELLGAYWRDEEEKEFLTQKCAVPDSIGKVEDSILEEILACSSCRRNYRLSSKELKFYRMHKISVPEKCPHCRHLGRVKLRNPKKLWQGNCVKCKTDFESTYDSGRPEKLYCEKCYFEERY